MKKKTQINVRPINYLGSKLRMLEEIKKAIDDVENTDGMICDLFSGSGTVSKYILDSRDVIAVDIQEYSKILCEASMSHIETDLSVDEIIDSIANSDSYYTLNKVFKDLLNYEEICLEKAKEKDIVKLYEIIEKGSIYMHLNEGYLDISDSLSLILDTCCSEIKSNSIYFDTSMLTRYYGGLYFSYKQAVLMDCISSVAFEYKGLMKTKMLAALLSTASDIVNTIGKQFAQPLKVKDSKGNLKYTLCKKIIDDRSINVLTVYRKWLKYYFEIGKQKHKYIAICDDYSNALDAIKELNVKVIYADPPYTRYHYSRYYHVLETICLRDNPNVSTTFPNGKGGISRGIYRTIRHQSPFCIKSKVEDSFENLFEKVHELGVPLVLSYSPFDEKKAVSPRLQTIDQLVVMAKKYFDHVKIIYPGLYTHSKLNLIGKNIKITTDSEVLIVCK